MIAIRWIVLLILISGCDERATKIAREAADRQAQQNTSMADLNKEVASGTHQLVAADAQARREIIGVHRDMQAERIQLGTGWSALEKERRQIATQRRTESMLVPLIEAGGLLALAVALLGFCWYALVACRSSDGTEAQLNELLIREILPGETPLILASHRWPLLDQPGSDAPLTE